jgi:CRISPR-associated protein Csx17
MDAPGRVGEANRVTRIAPAQKAVEAAEAALTLGSGIGVEAFERVVIGKRNGLAFGALSVGEIPVTSDPAIRGLSSDARWWIERVRRSATMKSGHREPRLTGGVQAVDEALFQYARAPLADARARAFALQDVLIALAQLDGACHAAAARKSELRPLPFLPHTLYRALDEDSSLEHRIARSLAGLGGSAVSLRLRFDVAPVAMNGSGMAYADRMPEHWIAAQPLRSIAVLYQERLRLAIAGKREAVESTSPAWPEDAIEIVEGALTPVKARRLSQLIEAYALIEPPRASRPRGAEAAVRIPAAYAVARLVLDRLRRGDLRVIDLLLARRASDALGNAVRRLRTVDNLPGLPRDVSAVGGIDPEHLAAALAIPISHERAAYHTILQSALRSTSTGAMDAYVSDLSASTSKENR